MASNSGKKTSSSSRGTSKSSSGKNTKSILTIVIIAVLLVLSFFGVSVSGLLGDLGIHLPTSGDASVSSDVSEGSNVSDTSDASETSSSASGGTQGFCSTSKDDSTTEPVSNPTGELDVHFIDVEQADCILVQCEGETLLIDAGDTDNFDEISTYLGNLGVTRLDYVIATHPHADHIGSMAKVIQNYDIGTFIMASVSEKLTPTTKTYEKMITALEEKNCDVQEAVPLDTFQVGGATVTILGPNGEYDDLNNWSVVCRLVYGDVSFMFTGDAEATAEADILKLSTEFQSTVLKMGHHGSSSSTSQAFWDAVDPSYCVIMCGEGNDYGHPHKETLQLLDDYQIIPYRTDLNGDIVFHVADGKITVTTEK